MSLRFLKCTFLTLIFYIVICAEVWAHETDTLRGMYPLYGISSVIEEAQVNSTACYRELSEFRGAVDSGKVWGLEVLDASGRPPSGFLYGNNLWIGSHTQCIDLQNRKEFEIRNDKLNHMKTPFDYPPYELGFSVVMLRHNSTMQWQIRLPLDWIVQLGLCVPTSCTAQELYDLSDKYFSKELLEFQKQYKVSLDVTKVRILTEDMLWIFKLPKTIVLVTTIGTILLLTIIGTIFDVKQHNREKNILRGHNYGITVIHEKDNKEVGLISAELVNNSPARGLTDSTKYDNGCLEILKCFSVYSNIKIWMSTKIGKESLSVIHGLRFFAMLWVITVHSIFFKSDFGRNPPYAYRISEGFFHQIFTNSTYCVDTYLFLSGFLLAYLFFKNVNPHKAMKKPAHFFRKSQQFLFMCFNRVLRLTPTYVILILLCDVIYTFYSKNSSLYYAEQPQEQCDIYWWRNLLYINNLYPRSEMCLSWSWYLSADMQFFIIASFLLLLSTIYFNFSACLVILLILIQIFSTAYQSYSVGYIPKLDDQLEHLDTLYDLPWNRIGPYLIGVITAYILEIKLKNKLLLKERTRLTLWVVFPLLNLWIVFTLYTRQVSVEFSAFYMGVSRTLWGIGIAWVLIATTTGNARLLEKFLSYKAWIPLSRLTYCVYLLNPLVMTMTDLGSETAIQASFPLGVISSCGIIMITYQLSFVFSLLFESPFILLTKLAFKDMIKQYSKSAGQEEIVQNGNPTECASKTTNSISTRL